MTTVRARLILPINQDPIENGVVTIQNGRVTSVGRWDASHQHSTNHVIDLGARIIMPGLVNAHCHLDYSNMAGKIPPPSNFSDWIKSILVLKSHWDYSDYAESWLAGAAQALRTGTTTLADVEAVPELLPQVWESTPLRLFSFLEMTGVRSNQNPKATLDQALDFIQKLPSNNHHTLGLSPHAPYSTSPQLLRLTSIAAQQLGLRTTIHVAESHEEFEMFMAGKGLLFDWLKNQRPMTECGLGSPVAYLHQQGLLSPNLLAIHVNYLATGDLQLLANNQVNVAHCPRSHHYFDHAPFPFQSMRDAGINICLATDSLASIKKKGRKLPELNLFQELQTFAAIHPTLCPSEMLRMVTVNAAKALGRCRELGEISLDAHADLIGIPYEGDLHQSAEFLVKANPVPDFIMIQGQPCLSPAG